jgi:tRNA 2-selenouridine synthase
MTQRITIDGLRSLPETLPVADVRTPAEYAQGHIPGALNIPLFTNEERVRVGITYKKEGREAAILLGFDLVGSKWSGFIRQALEIAPDKKIAVHCWRGGMRSAAMAWAFDLYGFEVFQIQGGYKSYRRWAIHQLEKPYPLWLVGGMTGSGKTRVLHELSRLGEQVVDLEDLARHNGSSYGTLNRLVQPSQEQFENDLAARLATLDPSRRIWIEDESRNIGKCLLPKAFWTLMRDGDLFDLQVPTEHRVGALLDEYGGLDRDFLVECTDRIRKRLGPEQTKHAIEAIQEGRMEDFIRLVLVYYDKTYRKGLSDRDGERITPIPADDTDASRNACRLLEAAGDASSKTSTGVHKTTIHRT